jgi:tricorn protease
MKHLSFMIIAAAALSIAAGDVCAIEGRLMRNPDIHGDRVVFTYEDDLWSAPVSGGLAARLTTHPGVESCASFSPGGEWIAFTGSYDGGNDVYVIPSKGGEPVRLTYHPANDRVVGWTPDSRYVLFVSLRGICPELFGVAVNGGPEKKYPLDQVAYASFSEDGKRVALNRFNSDRMNWKGYKGGAQQDVYVAGTDGTDWKKITDWEGYDNFPMWQGNTIYFNSDREDGRMNLYAYDVASERVKRCTHHADWDVEFPAIGGDRIVYGCLGYLYVYDVKTGEDEKLSIEIPSDRWQMRDLYINPGGYLQEIGLGSDGKKCVVQARGDIYLLDTEKERARNLTRTPGSRELMPALSPKADTVAFFSDRTGEYELYIAPTKPDAEWTQITKGSRTYYYHCIWSPDGKKLLFGDKDYRIYVADVASAKIAEIDRCLYQNDNEIFWEVSDYQWSPDSRWIVYSKTNENLNSGIYLYNIESKKIYILTDDRYDSYSPCFDAEGKHVYFLSLRNFTPALDPFMENNVNEDMSCVMAMQLRAGEKPPFDEAASADDEKAPAKADTAGAKEGEPIRIDLDGIQDRVFMAPVPPGTYKMLSTYKGHLAYLSRKGFGFPGLQEFFNPKSVDYYDLHTFDVESKTDKIAITGIGYYMLSGNGEKAAYISGMTAGVVKLDAASSAGDGALAWGGFEQKVEVSEEYPQIYRDVWRQIRDFFYDPDIHGRNWDDVYRKYEELIPFVATRADMNYIIGQMIGELTASHEYVIGNGGPPRTFYSRVNVGLLGADLEPDAAAGRYRFTHILEGAAWSEDYRSPLRAPDVDVKKGDYLISIDGRNVKADENYLKCLENKAGERVEIAVSPSPDGKGARKYVIKPLFHDGALRYYEWVEGNYRKVREATGGRVGYMHLSDMDELGIQQFEQAFRAERCRDGLIIDVRDNGGGFMSYFLIDKLERKLEYMTVTRDFKTMRYPHAVHAGPIVVLCNEGTGSDGEVFTQHFKDLGLGTVIGTPTWGGLIGITNIIPLTDGGMVTQSNIGFANLKGEWIVENRGAIPHIIVENDPAEAVKGRDQQLEKAIETVMQMLKDAPPEKLVAPPFPKK